MRCIYPLFFSLARGGSSSCQIFFYDEFLLMWCNFKFEGVLFRSDSRHNDRVDSLYWSVPQSRQSRQWLSGIETKLLGASGYWQNNLKMDSCLRSSILKFDGVLFNLDSYRRMPGADPGGRGRANPATPLNWKKYDFFA